MNNHQRLMARKAGKPAGYRDGSPRGGGHADGGVIERLGDAIKGSRIGGIFSDKRPEPETLEEKTKRLNDNAKRAIDEAREASARSARRQGPVYPGGNPYAAGGRVPTSLLHAAVPPMALPGQGYKSRRPMLSRPAPIARPYAKGGKVGKVMEEFEQGTLRSGSKHGPKVTSRDQAIAIGLSEARKAGEPVKPKAA